ncbi:hypothetical protein ABW636_07185 [Aquimarina sp. 2201CG1-2-11]|uniref:hypothetical protein n=1 Tax=Aquimarina discodermiae TaxID=3231043 RepID=UPI003461B021
MDELELLKKDWQKQKNVFPKLSYNEIYQMILKKSSSIVRWIFIISILEFVLWTSLDIVFRLNGMHTKIENVDMGLFSIFSSILSYSVLVYFMVRFYQNYRKIKTTDSTKVLMENILKTRRTVRQYIFVSISLFAIVLISTIIYIFSFTDQFQNSTIQGEPPLWVVLVSTLMVVLIFVGLIALFYRLIYGILTRKLKKNYKELEKLEV